MEAKTRFRALVVVTVAVLVGAGIFMAATLNAGVEVGWTVVSALVLVILALVAVAVTWKGWKDTQSGFPKEDERSRAIRMRAGYLSFYIGLYFLLGMGFVQAFLEGEQILSRPSSEWAMVYVAAMGSIFLAVQAYLNRKGVPA